MYVSTSEAFSTTKPEPFSNFTVGKLSGNLIIFLYNIGRLIPVLLSDNSLT
jgi:hypothetical protein